MLLLALMAVVAVICIVRFRGGEQSKDKKIVLLHTFSEDNNGYDTYYRELESTLKKEGITPEIREYFLDFDKGIEAAKHRIIHYKDTVMKEDWHPDIIICDGDASLNELYKMMKDKMFPRENIRNMKTIACGVHYPNWEIARDYPNIVILTDYIDYITNLMMAHEISKKAVIEVDEELHSFASDIRSELLKAIMRPPFINNSLRKEHITEEILRTTLRDSIIVTGLDVNDNTSDIQVGKCRMSFAKRKADNNDIMTFTPMRACFYDEDSQVLAGFLATYKTMAHDAAMHAAQVLNGTDISQLRSHDHKKDFVMNYNVMKRFGMEYKDYEDSFIIENVPFSVAHPQLYLVLIIGIILLCIGITTGIAVLFLRIREYNRQSELQGLIESAELSREALASADGRIIRSGDELEMLLKDVDEEYQKDADELRQLLFVEGTHVKDILLPMQRKAIVQRDESKKVYEWWRAIINIEKMGNGVFDIQGILINVDENKRREAMLKKMEQIAIDTKKKEDFLTAVSHEIRTPLNAILGFCDILAMTNYGDFPEEEYVMMKQSILSNNYSLTKIITDILLFSKLETNNVQYVFEDIDAARFVTDFYKNDVDKLHINNNVKLMAGRDKVLIHADRFHLTNILMQYISNASKFSSENSEIRIGWQYHLNTKMMEIFVEDDGIGISLDKQSALFGLFWKDNEFVPGIGIGLNIVKTLVEGMGGEVRIDSRPDIGSRFSILFKKSGECEPIER
ncbi:MAG: HAMP domain-containing histidine kinase [Prevotella sp.]|nr:HAMP domain-containing histidine kinase [Prevotella sp.]